MTVEENTPMTKPLLEKAIPEAQLEKAIPEAQATVYVPDEETGKEVMVSAPSDLAAGYQFEAEYEGKKFNGKILYFLKNTCATGGFIIVRTEQNRTEQNIAYFLTFTTTYFYLYLISHGSCRRCH